MHVEGRRHVLDVGFTAFMGFLMLCGLRYPFVWVLAYIYIDILSPQKISWGFLSSIPISLIVFVAAFGGWILADDKRGVRVSFRQFLMLAFLVYCAYTTLGADFRTDAVAKWSWVWKSMVFAIFLPFTLTTRVRLEGAILFMVLSLGAIAISLGLKTIFSGGGGYGATQSFVGDNTGLYEGSIMSAMAVAIIPLIIWLAKHGKIFPPDNMVRLIAAGFIFACVLVPIGTQARTGLVCIALIGVMMLRTVKRRALYIACMLVAVVSVIPFLPQSYLDRMSTIQSHQSDQSASTRMAVWQWTWEYVKDNPFGGGFDSFRGNSVRYQTQKATVFSNTTTVESTWIEEKGRAFHSSYFEVLGEQGYPGFILWMSIHIIGFLQLEGVRRRASKSDDPQDQSDRDLADALQQGYIVYLVGAVFVGIGYQAFAFLLIAIQISFVLQVKRRRAEMRAAAFLAKRQSRIANPAMA